MKLAASVIFLVSMIVAEGRLEEKQEAVLARMGTPVLKSDKLLVFRSDEVESTFKFKDGTCWQAVYRKPDLLPLSNDQIEAILKLNGYGQEWKRSQIGEQVTFERKDGKATAVVDATVGFIVTSKRKTGEDEDDNESAEEH